MDLKTAFGRLMQQTESESESGLGPISGACLAKVYGIHSEFIKSIHKEAAALYRTEPWKRLRPRHLFGVKVGKDSYWTGNKMPYPCAQFIGGDGGDTAFYLFRSEKDARKMTTLRGIIRVPNVEVLRVTYEKGSLMWPSCLKMIENLSLEASGSDLFPVFDIALCMPSGDIQFRNPTVEELKFVYAFMKAISLMHPLLKIDKESCPIHSSMMYFEPFIETVDIHWPTEVTKGGPDLVAVTISFPPGHSYKEKDSSTARSTATKSTEPARVKSAEPPRVKFADPIAVRFDEPAPVKFAEPTPTKYTEPTTTKVCFCACASLRQCAMCEKEVHDEQRRCCGWCRALVYCSSICMKRHWKDSHKNMCAHYEALMEKEDELAIKIFSFPCSADHPCKWLESLGIHRKGMWRRRCKCYSDTPFGLLDISSQLEELWGGLSDSEYPLDAPFQKNHSVSSPFLLSGWSEYYDLRSLSMASPVADILSHPLTVYYILTTVNIGTKNILQKRKEVIVHYLGTEGELDWVPAFVEVGHLLNGFGNVQIVMVGPEIPSSLSGTSSAVGSRVMVKLVRGVYQEEATSLPDPHVIIALNCGLESYSSWGGALDVIKSKGVPAFFTEKTEIACLNDRRILRDAELIITDPVSPNPFRSPVKTLGFSCNLPSYSNGFIYGVNS